MRGEEKKIGLTCSLCRAPGDFYEVESPAIRLCSRCRDRLRTHLAVVCYGCDTLYWLPKIPSNIMRAAEMSGLPPQQILGNPVLQKVETCKRCFDSIREYVKESQWLVH